MPPRGVTSPKQKRQYEHIKDSELKEGRSTATREADRGRDDQQTACRSRANEDEREKGRRWWAEEGGRRSEEVERWAFGGGAQDRRPQERGAQVEQKDHAKPQDEYARVIGEKEVSVR